MSQHANTALIEAIREEIKLIQNQELSTAPKNGIHSGRGWSATGGCLACSKYRKHCNSCDGLK